MQSLLLAATIAVRVPRGAIGIASSVNRAAPPRMAAEFRAIELSSSSAPRPALLFLPGIDGTGRAGASQWPRLASDFDVYGLALPPEDRSTFDAVVDAIVAWLEANRDRPGRLLVGESTGAVLALAAALRAPQSVDALCLVNPATSFTGTPLSVVAPLLPLLPAPLYSSAPGLITPLFGKPGWFRSVVGDDSPAPTLPAPDQIVRASRQLSEVLPPATLQWRLQVLLTDGVARVNRALEQASSSSSQPPWASSTLLLAGSADAVLPSTAEVRRLAALLPGSTSKVLPGAGHACLDDTRSLNLRLELALAGVLDGFVGTPSAPPDPAPASAFEGWLQQMRGLFSPVFYTTDEDGARVAGLSSLPDLGGGQPVLLVGNHQLYGFDGPLIIEEVLREQGALVRPLVFPPLLAEESPLAPFPYPLPGTKETFERFSAVPVSGRNMYKLLKEGKTVLLFPGGAREVFKRKGEKYKLFWPQDDFGFVRLAAKLNATILPFSGLGGDDSFELAVDSQELMDAPAVGAFFQERVAKMPSYVEGDIFVPPAGLILPERYYFQFGRPVSTAELRADDEAGIASLHAQLQRDVEAGIDTLRECRERDPYRQFPARAAWEAVNGVQAPSS